MSTASSVCSTFFLFFSVSATLYISVVLTHRLVFLRLFCVLLQNVDAPLAAVAAAAAAKVATAAADSAAAAAAAASYLQSGAADDDEEDQDENQGTDHDMVGAALEASEEEMDAEMAALEAEAQALRAALEAGGGMEVTVSEAISPSASASSSSSSSSALSSASSGAVTASASPHAAHGAASAPAHAASSASVSTPLSAHPSPAYPPTFTHLSASALKDAHAQPQIDDEAEDPLDAFMKEISGLGDGGDGDSAGSSGSASAPMLPPPRAPSAALPTSAITSSSFSSSSLSSSSSSSSSSTTTAASAGSSSGTSALLDVEAEKDDGFFDTEGRVVPLSGSVRLFFSNQCVWLIAWPVLNHCLFFCCLNHWQGGTWADAAAAALDKNKLRKLMEVVDHSKIAYEPIRKDFYVEAPEITRMTDDEVRTSRAVRQESVSNLLGRLRL